MGDYSETLHKYLYALLNEQERERFKRISANYSKDAIEAKKAERLHNNRRRSINLLFSS